MTTFNDKEKAAENKYAHDKEVEFKVHVRRNKLLGLWVAGKIGLTGAAAETYAKSVATVDLGKISEETVFHAVKKEFVAKRVSVSDHDIRAEMHRLLHIVREEIATK